MIGDYQEGAAQSLVDEELSYRAYLRRIGKLDEYEAQMEQIIQEGLRAAASLEGSMDFEETGSQVWDWEEADDQF